MYDRFTRAAHQQCLRHLQRRCQELLAMAQGDLTQSGYGRATRLPRAVLALIDRAFALRRAWRSHRLSADELCDHGLTLACELEHLVSGNFTNDANRRLANHILKHAMSWFWFLIDPMIDATNWRAEQALRPAVVNRKVWAAAAPGPARGRKAS